MCRHVTHANEVSHGLISFGQAGIPYDLFEKDHDTNDSQREFVSRRVCCLTDAMHID